MSVSNERLKEIREAMHAREQRVRDAIEAEEHKLDTLIGASVVAARSPGGRAIVLDFDNGLRLTAYEGDAGTLRSPEPYFHFALEPIQPPSGEDKATT